VYPPLTAPVADGRTGTSEIQRILIAREVLTPYLSDE
jgi:hypothetical protein